MGLCKCYYFSYVFRTFSNRKDSFLIFFQIRTHNIMFLYFLHFNIIFFANMLKEFDISLQNDKKVLKKLYFLTKILNKQIML